MRWGTRLKTKTKNLTSFIRSKMAPHANKGNRTQITASDPSRFLTFSSTFSKYRSIEYSATVKGRASLDEYFFDGLLT
jgi:hypothetical protein